MTSFSTFSWLFLQTASKEMASDRFVYQGKRKPEYLEENPHGAKDETQQQTQVTHDVESGNRTPATMVRGRGAFTTAPFRKITFFQGLWLNLDKDNSYPML